MQLKCKKIHIKCLKNFQGYSIIQTSVLKYIHEAAMKGLYVKVDLEMNKNVSNWHLLKYSQLHLIIAQVCDLQKY